jgi:hypothetical protein
MKSPVGSGRSLKLSIWSKNSLAVSSSSPAAAPSRYWVELAWGSRVDHQGARAAGGGYGGEVAGDGALADAPLLVEHDALHFGLPIMDRQILPQRMLHCGMVCAARGGRRRAWWNSVMALSAREGYHSALPPTQSHRDVQR